MNDLVKKDGVLKVIETQGIQNIIKQLNKKIFLVDSLVLLNNGLIDPKELIKKQVKLKRVNEVYDDLCINVYTLNDELLGEIDSLDKTILARLLDAGKELEATVKHISNLNKIKMLTISVSLVDF